MKHRIKKLCSLIIALSMLLSLIPLYGAAMVDEFEGLETIEEIPFEFVLEPGDLPYELLKEAVLAPEDLPACLDPDLAEARGHVNRLYLQEPDDNTVMFQNRDGSKTVYLFSQPVKGMTATTARAFEINGTSLSFSGNNAITSRVGVTLSNFNIGYAEVAYIPGGVLTEDGVNITEDVRDWARGESTVSALTYNISGEAAAEYAASVAVPETDVAATAAAAPGITITPNDPAPLGGMTVMSISYSDLAGVMSFKSVSANKYLTLHPTNLNTLMTYNRILVPYSRWVVSYDVTTGFTIANLYQPANKYLGFDDTDSFIIDPLSYMMDMFTLGIESSTENIVTINCGQIAISSTGALYEKNEDDDYFPTSCQWEIVSKTNYAPVQSITTSRIRTVNAEEPFYEAYTTNPAEPTYSDIKLHYASNHQVVPTDSDFDMDDLCAYEIAEPGMYQVYYKDVSSGVRSANFWLNVIQNVRGITPASSVRIEQSGVGFDLDYTVLPELANNYSISLYYASNDEEVDYEEDEDGEPDYYYIDTPGIYSVYYKDSVSGVTSPEFQLIILDPTLGIYDSVSSIPSFGVKTTYSIQPISDQSKYLTMNMSNTSETEICVGTYNSTLHGSNIYESWDTLSRAFTIVSSSNNRPQYKISSILTKSQYCYPEEVCVKKNSYDGTEYRLTESSSMPNTLNMPIIPSNNNYMPAGMGFPTNNDSNLTILQIEDYYVIFATSTDNNNILNNPALKYEPNGDYSVVVKPFDPTDEAFRWQITPLGVDAPMIMQTQMYTCGPATFLQVLYGAGLGESVTDVNNNSTICLHEKMMKLLNRLPYQLNSDGTYGTVYSMFTDHINYYYFNNRKESQCYKMLDKTTSNVAVEEFKTKITNSLAIGWAPFVETNTGGVPYKQSSGGAHYICIIGYEENTDHIIVANCHYDEDVLGIYAIPLNDFYDKVRRLYYYE